MKVTVINYEFDFVYEKLITFKKRFYGKSANRNFIFNLVKNMSRSEFEELVSIVVNNPDKKLSIHRLLKDRRSAEKRIRETRAVIEAQAKFDPNAENGLKDILKQYNASNVLEVMQKLKEGYKP